MTNVTTTYKQFDQRFAWMAVQTVFLSLVLVFTQVARAAPIMVEVYGAPYFTLAGSNADVTDNRWIVMGADQGLHINLEEDQLNIVGQQDLSVLNRSGQSSQFSFLEMSVNLPESRADNHGFIDYSMGDQSGQFTLEQVIYKSPRGIDDSLLSLFFWGIDYANGVGLVLGLEAASIRNIDSFAAQVSEPSMALLMLLGLGVFGIMGKAGRINRGSDAT